MTNIIRLVLISVISLCLLSFVGTQLFNYFYQSEVEKAIEKSTLYLEQVNKSQEAYIEAKYIAENNMLKNQLEFERKVNSQIRSSQQDNSYQSHNYKEQNRIRREAYQLAQQQKSQERLEKRNKRIEQIKRENEKDRADRAHIRKENIKTCMFWTDKFKENPNEKNKLYKEKSCKRAYY